MVNAGVSLGLIATVKENLPSKLVNAGVSLGLIVTVKVNLPSRLVNAGVSLGLIVTVKDPCANEPYLSTTVNVITYSVMAEVKPGNSRLSIKKSAIS